MSCVDEKQPVWTDNFNKETEDIEFHSIKDLQ